jgi:menaquinone-dependent protoporphyrinogen oxidase
MKVLVTAASKHGSTMQIAAAIADELRKAHLDVDLREVGKVKGVEGYDAVVFGSAVYAGSWLPEAKRFAQAHRVELARNPLWIFSSGPLGAPEPQPRDDPAKYASPLGDVPIRDHRIFVGKLDSEELGFAERLIVKVVKAPDGDFRDWADIKAWAGEIAHALSQEPAEAAP